MKKILLINGSPRYEGNTRLILQELKREIDKKGYKTDFVDLYDTVVNPCLNCDFCKNNHGRCFMNDDTNDLLDKIEGADIILWGSPVYWWGITAKMKLLIDKFYARDDRFKTLKKEMGLITIGANDLSDKQYELIKEQFTCIADYLGWTLSFYLPLSAYEAGEIMKDNQVIEAIYNIADSI